MRAEIPEDFRFYAAQRVQHRLPRQHSRVKRESIS